MQLFPKSSNYFSKASLAVVGLVVAVLGLVAERLYKSSYNPMIQTKVAKEQPVPFSHLHHVKGLGIDCRYCHTGVDQSGVAGIPPVKTCMNCHSQIWTESPMLAPVREAYKTGKPIEWVKINRLPDHVYFNHSVHVNKGMACTTCHGPVGEMPLVWKEHQMWMKWCLECHNNPAKFVQPKSTVTDMHYKAPQNEKEFREQLVREYHIKKLTDCSTCHR